MVVESNLNVFLIQINASGFVDFEISEIEISRFDCIDLTILYDLSDWLPLLTNAS